MDRNGEREGDREREGKGEIEDVSEKLLTSKSHLLEKNIFLSVFYLP